MVGDERGAAARMGRELVPRLGTRGKCGGSVGLPQVQKRLVQEALGAVSDGLVGGEHSLHLLG